MFEIEDIIAIILNNLTIGETLELIERLQNTKLKEWRSSKYMYRNFRKW